MAGGETVTSKSTVISVCAVGWGRWQEGRRGREVRDGHLLIVVCRATGREGDGGRRERHFYIHRHLCMVWNEAAVMFVDLCNLKIG